MASRSVPLRPHSTHRHFQHAACSVQFAASNLLQHSACDTIGHVSLQHWDVCQVGQSTKLQDVPADLAARELGLAPDDRQTITIDVKLKRVGPVKRGRMRTVVLEVAGREEALEVKEPAGADEFDGPMANAADKRHVGAPMPGNVEKLLCQDGQAVAEGDVLAVISAMKMEVQVRDISGCLTGAVGLT